MGDEEFWAATHERMPWDPYYIPGLDGLGHSGFMFDAMQRDRDNEEFELEMMKNKSFGVTVNGDPESINGEQLGLLEQMNRLTAEIEERIRQIENEETDE